MHISICTNLQSINAEDWNALLCDNNPFLQHAFLAGLEQYGCLGEHVGWFPQHLLIHNDDQQLVAAMPTYLKTNGFGEFVFDWAWADAYTRHGLDYYPKLVCSIPFTPVTGPRLLIAPTADHAACRNMLIHAAQALVEKNSFSSAHWLFPDQQDMTVLKDLHILPRLNYQYHWHNQGYESFAHYLSRFRSRRRKNVRRERQSVLDAGITVRVFHGDELEPDLWPTVYDFYQDTFLKKGNYPALTLEFFLALGKSMGNKIVIILAEQHGQFIAGTINFRSDDTLYGRYWGCATDIDNLHFELCFYAGIEYCIQHGLQRYEPGAQGEHKISRGFLPQPTWSAHWIVHPGYRAAIADFLQREQTALKAQRVELDKLSPFRTEQP